MKMYFDEKIFQFEGNEKNIVEVALKNGLKMEAPCFWERKTNVSFNGCCKACIIEVNGKKAFACATVPQNGIKITYNTPQLVQKRKDNLEKFKLSMDNGTPCTCTCDCPQTQVIVVNI